METHNLIAPGMRVWLLMAALALSVLAQETTLGREVPAQVGVYELVGEAPLQRGDVVTISRAGLKLGEAFVVQTAPLRISLKGNFTCVPGDQVSLLRSAPRARPQDIPDLCQQQPDLPGDGSTYCGPVAVSNSLVWLSRNGFPGLVRGDQLTLVKELGQLMGTDADGTDGKALAQGLTDYLRQVGYSPAPTVTRVTADRGEPLHDELLTIRRRRNRWLTKIQASSSSYVNR